MEPILSLIGCGLVINPPMEDNSQSGFPLLIPELITGVKNELELPENTRIE